ncbi:hypothetical protein [Bradyrhizobium cytisi]|uniref:DUF1311 domain-containing protein n=1 Tax=Bradyrhizobium cytisi TaxID=515489 RepID=A0A5S4WHI4_9BRAD|nr:hypothetical protein [Bradyrhizobium cytisi]TYL81641.1 hypothetical protein FXB38_22640 [Bradyrhizobium cytisi]
MLLSISLIILSSQLVVAAADTVPKFDIGGSCKATASAAAGMSEDQPVKRCISDEQDAQRQLESQWSTFTSSSRVSCAGMENITRSYVSLLTCLQFAKQAK